MPIQTNTRHLPPDQAPSDPNRVVYDQLKLKLADLPARDREFASSLVAGYEKFGRFTERQLPHAVRLAAWLPPKPTQAHQVGSVNLTRIAQMFDLAHSRGLRSPKVKIQPREMLYTLKRAADGGQNPGAIYVKQGEAYLGKVLRDGSFFPGRELTNPAPVLEDLRAFAQDPAGVAGVHGQRFGWCCFCSRTLTDGRSIAVGYGPTCADKFGMPWGDVKVSTTVTVTSEEV
jgi:hypothetical protein